MTAVNPTRLRFQIQGLLSFFDSPKVFHTKLRDLFNSYGNHALRFGESTLSIPLIPMYHLPNPVMRQLELDLKPLVQDNLQKALTLAYELWQDSFFEIQQVAILILGNISTDNPELILQCIKAWLSPETDPVIANHLFSVGTDYLQSHFPEAWEALIHSYLADMNPKYINFGLIGLIEGLKSPSFTNLPAVFRLISPFMQNPDPDLMRSLEKLIISLAHHSPVETAFFLKQALSVSISSETPRLVKTCIEAFPETLQAELRSALKR